jgi:hypothetical protein
MVRWDKNLRISNLKEILTNLNPLIVEMTLFGAKNDKNILKTLIKVE